MLIRRPLTLLLIGAFAAAGSGAAAAPGEAKPRVGKAKAKTTRQLKATKDRRTRRHLPAQAFFGRPLASGLLTSAPGGAPGTGPGAGGGAPATGTSGPGSGPGGSSAADTTGTGNTTTGGAAVALGVRQADTPDYSTTLSRSSVPAGSVLVQLQNTGEDPHNLRIIRSDGTGTATQFASVAPGATSTRSVTLGQGSYRLLCTLTAPSSHDAAGMNATLTVNAQR